MKKLIGKRGIISVLVVTFVLVGLSIFLAFKVNTNYDLSVYLPKDSQTSEGLEVLEETFGNFAMVELMVKDVTLTEAATIKTQIQGVEGIKQVAWLNDNPMIDINHPEFIPPELMAPFYNDGNALFTVVFEEDSYALEVEDSINEIREILVSKDVYIRGEAANNIEARNISEGELLKMILIILPVCLIVLIFASMSWIEPIIILVVLGIGVLVNLGTNAFLPSVSFITLTIAAALQLAISLDYSLFFIHRYYEFKDEGYTTAEAVNKAFKKALPVITASAITTIIGFLSLLFMRYRIGLDIGIVLSKGILLSYLSVIFILPVFIVVFDKLLQKTRHRSLMFHLGGLKKIFVKFRYVFIGLVVVILGVGIYFQTQTEFIFGSGDYGGSESQVAVEKKEIGKSFGNYETITILLKHSPSSEQKEKALIAAFAAFDTEHKKIMKIDAMYTAVGMEVPEDFVPEYVKAIYNQNGYARMTLYTSFTEENEEMFIFNEDIDNLVSEQYEEYYMLGIIPSTADIKETVLKDETIVLLLSSILIAIVLFIVFKNIYVAVLLILVIQTAIWLNVGLLAMTGTKVVYIGYLVVLALQLGATIDYAVLFASRYLEARETKDKDKSLSYTLRNASIPIMVSGVILAAAGFAEMIFSDLSVVSDIGLLIGRGALLSLMMVLFFLPSITYVSDRWFVRKKIRDKVVDEPEEVISKE